MAYHYIALLEQAKTILFLQPRASLMLVSAELGVDRHTLERAVRTLTGRTFAQLQRELLRDRAQLLLTESPALSVKEIAFQLGYGSPRAFSRFIRVALGFSPSELRNVPGGSARREA